MWIEEKAEGPGEVGGVLQALWLDGEDVSELEAVPFISNATSSLGERLLDGKRRTDDEAS